MIKNVFVFVAGGNLSCFYVHKPVALCMHREPNVPVNPVSPSVRQTIPSYILQPVF